MCYNQKLETQLLFYLFIQNRLIWSKKSSQNLPLLRTVSRNPKNQVSLVVALVETKCIFFQDSCKNLSRTWKIMHYSYRILQDLKKIPILEDSVRQSVSFMILTRFVQELRFLQDFFDIDIISKNLARSNFLNLRSHKSNKSLKTHAFCKTLKNLARKI